MRNLIWGILVLVGLGTLVAGDGFDQDAVPAQVALARMGPTADLIAMTTPASEGRQQVIVVDPKSRSMSVYHIDLQTGAIALKSVRNIHADLMMDQLNTASPLPKEIRAMLLER